MHKIYFRPGIRPKRIARGVKNTIKNTMYLRGTYRKQLQLCLTNSQTPTDFNDCNNFGRHNTAYTTRYLRKGGVQICHPRRFASALSCEILITNFNHFHC